MTESYEELRPYLFAIAYRMLGSVAQAEDVVQEAFLRYHAADVEPDSREFKYYAPGVGLVRVEEGLDASLGDPELTFNRVEVAPIPLPPGLVLIGTGLFGLLVAGRRQMTTTLAPRGTRS